MRVPSLLWLALAMVASPAWAKLPPELAAKLPAPASRPIDFAKDIQPILEASCVQCHGRGKAKGNFSLETRADLLTGGDSGPAAIVGKSGESLVVEMVSGLNAEIVMPQKGKKLTLEQVALVRAWIDQGLRWPEEINFLKREPANLRPTDIAALPRNSKFEHPVDALVDAYFTQKKQSWPKVIDDRAYARRVYLDTIGLLPTPTQLAAFVDDRAPDKRARLVTRLLADNQRYAEHWLTFWNDLLRNDYKGAGYIDGGRRPITRWLYTALAQNLPYNQFAAQLVNPGAEAEGFTSGILWRGAVNASMVPPMQAAQSVAQVFLGVNLKCASCHDSFINEYTLADSYGLASIYADGPLEIAECDKPTGHNAKIKFLYEEIGTIDPKSDPATHKQRLMEIITSRENGRLPRTIVNRLWQRFLGYGLVEPVDEMDRPAWSPELLDWLAEDLVAHRYDLKHTIARILTSRTYQLEAADAEEKPELFVFRGPSVRRLSAEQFTDAIMSVTGQTFARADARLNRTATLQPATEPLALQPKWIWGAADAHVKAKPATYIFRRTLQLTSQPTEAHVAISADDNYTVRINGRIVGTSGRRNSTGIDWLDLSSSFQVGENVIEITASNMPPDEGRLVSVKLDDNLNPDSPAGLILYARIQTPDATLDVVSDHAWKVLVSRPPVTAAVPVADAPPPNEVGAAVELGGVDLAPWRLGAQFLNVAAASKDTLPVARASLVAADPLMSALGRPNREQVMTVRQASATTLQALELTNGATLARTLRNGACKLFEIHEDTPPAQLAAHLYHQTLGRAPTPREQAIGERMLGKRVSLEGIEDLLWAVAMLPEFQLIY